MFVLATILALVAAAAGVPMHDGRIVGGTDTTIEKYPHQISLQKQNSHFCGGSIISKNYVLSAAHCVLAESPKYITIRVGATIRGKNGTVMEVESIKYNPDFNLSLLDGDVSVLKLKEPIVFNKKAQPIALVPINNEPKANELLTVTGWGTTDSGDLAVILQEVEVPVVDIQQCRRAYGEQLITETMICAGLAKKDSCQGDSGGPLINAKRELVGIVSWGRGCGTPGYPGVYGSVASTFIHNFITKNIKNDE